MTNLHAIVPAIPYYDTPLWTEQLAHSATSGETYGWIEAVWMEREGELERPLGLFRPNQQNLSPDQPYIVWIDDRHGEPYGSIIRGSFLDRQWIAISASTPPGRGRPTSAVHFPALQHPWHRR